MRPVASVIPPVHWAYDSNLRPYQRDVQKSRELLQQAGYSAEAGKRVHLVMKISTTEEASRLLAMILQQQLHDAGIDLEIRTFEFATLYADVLKGNFQMFTLQWVGGAVADPDILRRVFDSRQTPPSGFNRGFFQDPRVDRLLDEAARSTDDDRRRALFGDVQRLVAEEAPYISLWYKTNAAVAQRNLAGIHLLPTADFIFLKDVSRTSTRETAH